MQGWFKLHRELFETDLWFDVSTFRLFIYLISKASHKDGVRVKGIELKRGQYIRSYRKLADDLSYKEGRGYKKYSLSTIKSCVNKLIESERVNVRETEAGTLFTIVNYAKYQDLNDFEEETPNTINEEVRTNAELTPNEVRTNSEQEQELKNLRTKELKEIKNSRKRVYDEDSPPYVLADFFYKEILKNNPNHKKPDLQKWSDDVRKMIELDDRDKKEIGALMRWVQQDDFEMTVVLSPAKLRSRYDALIMKMKKPKFPSNVKSIVPPVYEGGKSVERHDGKHSSEFGNVRLFK